MNTGTSAFHALGRVQMTTPITDPHFPLPIPRHVILPKELAKSLIKGRLLSEAEWRGIGVQQSRGWEHYAIHR